MDFLASLLLLILLSNHLSLQGLYIFVTFVCSPTSSVRPNWVRTVPLISGLSVGTAVGLGQLVVLDLGGGGQEAGVWGRRISDMGDKLRVVLHRDEVSVGRHRELDTLNTGLRQER
eukprot:238486_1